MCPAFPALRCATVDHRMHVGAQTALLSSSKTAFPNSNFMSQLSFKSLFESSVVALTLYYATRTRPALLVKSHCTHQASLRRLGHFFVPPLRAGLKSASLDMRPLNRWHALGQPASVGIPISTQHAYMARSRGSALVLAKGYRIPLSILQTS